MYKIVIIFFAISLVPAVVTAQPQVELVRAYDFDTGTDQLYDVYGVALMEAM